MLVTWARLPVQTHPKLTHGPLEAPARRQNSGTVSRGLEDRVQSCYDVLYCGLRVVALTQRREVQLCRRSWATGKSRLDHEDTICSHVGPGLQERSTCEAESKASVYRRISRTPGRCCFKAGKFQINQPRRENAICHPAMTTVFRIRNAWTSSSEAGLIDPTW